MRLIKALFALLFVAFGVLFGALNRDAVRIELGFHTFESATLGITVLLAVLAGALLAGLVLTIGVIWPLRHRLRRGAPAADAASAAIAPAAHE